MKQNVSRFKLVLGVDDTAQSDAANGHQTSANTSMTLRSDGLEARRRLEVIGTSDWFVGI